MEPSLPSHPLQPGRKGSKYSQSLTSSLPAQTRSPRLNHRPETAKLFILPKEVHRPMSAPVFSQVPTLQPIPTQLYNVPRSPPAIPIASKYNSRIPRVPFLRTMSLVPPKQWTNQPLSQSTCQEPKVDKNFAGLNATLSTSTAPFRAFKNTHIKQVEMFQKGAFRV